MLKMTKSRKVMSNAVISFDLHTHTITLDDSGDRVVPDVKKSVSRSGECAFRVFP